MNNIQKTNFGTQCSLKFDSSLHMKLVHGKNIHGNGDFNHYVENMMQSRNHAKSTAKNSKF